MGVCNDIEKSRIDINQAGSGEVEYQAWSACGERREKLGPGSRQ